MTLYDTQIVSYSWKHVPGFSCVDGGISSVVANEFLNMHAADKMSAKYYVPIANNRLLNRILIASDAKRLKLSKEGESYFPKGSTDKILYYFGSDFESFYDFNNYAIARTINDRKIQLFRKSIDSLDKRHRRIIMRKFEFILDSRIVCFPVTKSDIDGAYDILYKFIRFHAVKENFRNTWNDMMILSSAIERKAALISKDSLLNRFSATAVGIEPHLVGEQLKLDFTKFMNSKKRYTRDSKGYINRGWRAKILRR
jgi:hypothetical protein